MDITLRVHDTKGARLQPLTETLKRLFRKSGIDGDVVAVSESLEHCRLGIANRLPALELNGYILNHDGEMTPSFLEDFCSRLAGALKEK